MNDRKTEALAALKKMSYANFGVQAYNVVRDYIESADSPCQLCSGKILKIADLKNQISAMGERYNYVAKKRDAAKKRVTELEKRTQQEYESVCRLEAREKQLVANWREAEKRYEERIEELEKQAPEKYDPEKQYTLKINGRVQSMETGETTSTIRIIPMTDEYNGGK